MLVLAGCGGAGEHYSRDPASLCLAGRDGVDVDLDPEDLDSVAAEPEEVAL
jgi:hypothetical protein